MIPKTIPSPVRKPAAPVPHAPAPAALPGNPLLRLLLLFVLTVGMTTALQAQTLENIEQRVTEFTLENGLHVIVIQRDVAPVASFVTHVNVGSVNEQIGQTGLTHVFEHMAFKGSTTIGTTNWEEEKKVIAQMDDAYRAWLLESRKAEPDQANWIGCGRNSRPCRKMPANMW